MNISYLKWIKFRVDLIPRFLRFFAKTAKLNPRDINEKSTDREIKST